MADGVCIAHKDGVGLCRNGFPQKPFCRGQVGCLSCGNISAREIPSCLDDDFAPPATHSLARTKIMGDAVMGEVTQADRDAAADFYGPYLARPGEVLVTAHMRAGKIDESPLILAFARHRLASLSPERDGEMRAVAHHGSANSHIFDDQILVGGECIAFSDEPWTSRIVAALSHTEGKGS